MSPYSASAASFHGSAGWMLRFMGVSTLGAVTPTNRTVAPGTSTRRSRGPRSGPGVIASAGDRERGAQAGDLEDLARRGLEAPQLDAATTLAGPFQGPDEHPEAGRVDEVHPGEVDDDLAAALLDEPVELVPQRRCRGHVDLALDDHRRRPRVVADRDPKVLARGQVRARRDHGGQ